MRRFVASVAIVLAALSIAGAQEVCRQGSSPDLAGGVIGSTIGAPVGSTIGDGRGQFLAIGAGGLLGGLIGESSPPRRPAANRSNPVVRQMHDQRNQVIEAAVTGRTPMPRKARPILADKSLPRP